MGAMQAEHKHVEAGVSRREISSAAAAGRAIEARPGCAAIRSN
jgi:hypothetical protein